MKNKPVLIAAAITVLILLIPFLAMMFTNEVNWSPADFIIMGGIVFTAVFGVTYIMSRGNNINYKIAATLTIITGFLIIWINLAVGILGSGPNLPNLMYGGLIIVGILCAIAVNFRAKGMFYVLTTMAIAQILIPVIAFAIMHLRNKAVVLDSIELVIGFTAFFAFLWLASALLFRNAASNQKNTTETI